MTIKTVLFDINETTLDLNHLRKTFDQLLNHQMPLELWFSNLLHSSVVAVTTGLETRFADLARANLEKLMNQHQIKAKPDEIDDFLTRFASLPAHSDVAPALTQLQQSGLKTVAFSNSSSALLASQIENAQLMPLFDQIISVEEINSFKPSAKAYQYAAQCLNHAPEEVLLIAAHDWDVHGALSAGLGGAYLQRGPGLYNPLYLAPTLNGTSMTELSDKIIELSRKETPKA